MRTENLEKSTYNRRYPHNPIPYLLTEKVHLAVFLHATYMYPLKLKENFKYPSNFGAIFHNYKFASAHLAENSTRLATPAHYNRCGREIQLP